MTIRIMPLGDSITWGYNYDDPTTLSGYRKQLWEQLTAAGYAVDFVGSQSDGPAGPWDHDHEGHTGYRVDQIIAGYPAWYAAARPDVILLMIGINDILQGFEAGLAGQWAALLALFRTTSPTVRVLMSPLAPIQTTTADAASRLAQNALLPGIIATGIAAGTRVELAHVGDAMAEATALSSDRLHPSASGYADMAGLWYAALAPYFAALTAPQASLATLVAEVHVSLDGSGSFTGEDDRLLRAVRSIALDEGRDGAQQLSPPKVQAGDVELRNEDGRFSADRADSPYYQRLLPGRPVLYQAAHGRRRPYRSHTAYRAHVPYRGRTTYPLGRHVVDDLDQATEIGSRRVKLATLGWEALLTRAPVTVPLMTSPRVDQCVSALLDAVSWPADKRSIAVADTQLLYWWCDERHPWDALLELLASEGPGALYVDRDGVVRFENRNYRGTATRSTTSQATFYDRLQGQRTRYRAHVPYREHRPYRGRLAGLTHEGFRPASAFKSIYNRATYTTRRRTTAAPARIWNYGSALTLAANQVLPLFVRPSTPFTGAVAPVASTDYQVTAGGATVALTYSSGILAILTITAGAAGATIDGLVAGEGLQLRAQALTVVSETTVQNGVDASASIARFSPIPGQLIPLTYQVQGWPEIDPANAVGVCDAWVLRYQVPRPWVTFTLQNGDGAHLEQILRRRPSDRITLNDVQAGIAADFWINASKLTIADAGGRTVRLEVDAELCDELTGAVWDVSQWDAPAAVWGV